MNEPYHKDFRELIVEARDAVRKLFDESEPDSWMYLRYGYGELRKALDMDDAARKHGEVQRNRAAEDEAEAAWRRTSRAAREHLVLNAFGPECLTLHDICERIRSQGYRAYDHQVRPLAADLLARGEIDRVKASRALACKWLYFRRSKLGPEIQALQDALDATQEGGA